MRRTVSVALAVGVLVTLGAGGVASSATFPDLPGPPDPPPDLAPAQPGQPAPGAPERVGTVEQVDRVLDYLAPDQEVTFRYPGADYVKLHLSRLLLLPGDHLTVSGPAGEEVQRLERGWAMSVTGDTAVMRLHRGQADPAPSSPALSTLGAGLGVTVDKVAHGLTPAEESPVPDGREESICGRDDSRDAVCYRSSNPTIYRNTKPVARLLIDGVELCSAFRVGPRNRLLTNRHCLESSRQAQRTEVWFNYQCVECGGWAVFRPTKVRGARVLDTDRTLDYTLFSVDDFRAVERFGYLELDPEPTTAGVEVYIPQHPRGLPGRVALGSDTDRGSRCGIVDTRAHGYGWFTDVTYYCDTDGGSSGSPVLSRSSHRVIALHHFGGCPNSGVRMDLIHDRIAPAL
jgi:hypothetical protein